MRSLRRRELRSEYRSVPPSRTCPAVGGEDAGENVRVFFPLPECPERRSVGVPPGRYPAVGCGASALKHLRESCCLMIASFPFIVVTYRSAIHEETRAKTIAYRRERGQREQICERDGTRNSLAHESEKDEEDTGDDSQRRALTASASRMMMRDQMAVRNGEFLPT